MARLLAIRLASPDAGLVLESELATSLGATDNSAAVYVLGKTMPVAITGTYDHPDDGRDATLNGAAIGLATPTKPFDACWVRFWPPTDDPLQLLATASMSSGGTGEAVQWNPTLGRAHDPTAAFHALPLSLIAGAAAVVAAALAFVSMRLRRLELATALHVGVSRPALTGIALAETVIWLIPASAFAITALAFTATWHNPDPPLAAWLAGTRVVAVAAAAWILATGITAGVTRQSHLVHYFQQR